MAPGIDGDGDQDHHQQRHHLSKLESTVEKGNDQQPS
jgi:hypothetical protein